MKDGFMTPANHVRFEAKVLLGDEEIIIHKDEAYLVNGPPTPCGAIGTKRP